MRELGVIPSILDEPPFEDFWLFELVRRETGGGLEFFGDKYPIIWIYAIAEKLLNENLKNRNNAKY